MAVPHSAHVLEELDQAECHRLLGSAPIGRLGYSERALPMVVPVHCTVRGPEVLIGGPVGTKVAAAVRGQVVAFEVDGYQTATREGWTVGVVGMVREITDPAELAAVDALDFAPWTPGRPPVYLAVSLTMLNGHRLVRAAEAPARVPAGTDGNAHRSG
jgi:hypothetical protein